MGQTFLSAGSGRQECLPHECLRERVKGIEPSPKAWEAFVLPLNYTRKTTRLAASRIC